MLGFRYLNMVTKISVILWDAWSLNNKCISGFVLLSGLESLEHARKMKLILSPENFREK